MKKFKFKPRHRPNEYHLRLDKPVKFRRRYIYIGRGKWMLRVNRGIEKKRRPWLSFRNTDTFGYCQDPWISDVLTGILKWVTGWS